MIRLRSCPPYLRHFIAAFVLISLAGYAAGLASVFSTTGGSPAGMSDHYEGNEEEMSFGKSTGEMLTIIHTHVLGMGLLFLAIGLFFAASDFPVRWKGVLMIETMLTLLTTFGGLYFVSLGWRGAVWIVYPSSIAMVIGYVTMSVSILRSALSPIALDAIPVAGVSE